MRYEEFDLCMKVNACGPVMMIKAFEPLLIAAEGRIINIGSVSGILAGPNLVAYDMSKHAVEGRTDSLELQLAPRGVHASVFELGAFRSDIDKNMLARFSEQERAYLRKVEGSALDSTQYPEADEVGEAVEQALSDPNPKRSYLVIPRQSRDRLNNGLAEETIGKQMEQLVQLNEGQPFTFDRAALIKILDEELATARPRTK
jgi:NAD(P)-dependent dehydrogenase (short-subunit alcohol dehydrogenase family)